MKNNTIIITSFHPLISRNLMQTQVLDFLLKNFKVIVLCPDYKVDYFRRSFSKKNIKILGVKLESLSKFQSLWKELGNALLKTSTIKNNRHERYLTNKDRLNYFLFKIVQNTLANIRFIKRLYQVISPFIFFSNDLDLILKEYAPVGIFSTDIFHDEDVKLLSSAKLRNIKSIGMVRSWDNCTNKGILPIVTENILVHNYNLKKELTHFHFVNNSNISIVGIPQFDYYYNYRPANSELFFKKTGFDKDKKIILFAPTGFKFVDDDWYILDTILKAIERGKIIGNPQVLVRFPPGDKMNMDKIVVPKDIKVYIDLPGVSFEDKTIKDREMSKEDMSWLADSLYFSDVLISVGSTLCIDICAFDKPIIMPSLSVENIDLNRSMRKMYMKYHYKYLIDSEACYYSNNVDDFVFQINRALIEPKEKNLDRSRLLFDQVGFFDGQNCHRLADRIVQIINND